MVLRQISHRQARIAADREQQIVEVVRHAAGERAERFDLLHALLMLERALALGDVAADADQARDAILRVVQRRLDGEVPKRRAVAIDAGLFAVYDRGPRK